MAINLATDDLDGHVEDLSDLKDRVGLAAQAGGHVMGRAGLVPAVHELTGANRELHAHVCVTEGKDRAVNVLALCNHKLKVAVAVLRNAQEGDGTVTGIELGEVAAAGFAMKHGDDLERRLLGGRDIGIARAGVTDNDDVFGEVDGVHLGKLAGARDGLEDAHGDGDLHIALDRAARALLDEHGKRRDEHGVEHAGLALGIAVVVASDQTDLLVLDPLLKGDNVLGHLLDGLVGDLGAALDVEGVENLGGLGIHGSPVVDVVGDGPHLLPVKLLGVEAQTVVEVGLVDIEVHHARVRTADLGNVGTTQATTYLGGTAPLLELLGHSRVATLDDTGHDGMTLAGAVKVGHDLSGGAAGVQIAQPRGDVGIGIVGLGLLLHVDHDDGHIQVAHDRQHVVARGIGEHLQDDQVDVLGAELVAGDLGLLLGGHHAAVDKLDSRGQRGLKVLVLLFKVGNELRELRKIGTEGDREDADLGTSIYKHDPKLLIMRTLVNKCFVDLDAKVTAGVLEALVADLVEEVIRTTVGGTRGQVDLGGLLNGVRQAKGRVEVGASGEQAVMGPDDGVVGLHELGACLGNGRATRDHPGHNAHTGREDDNALGHHLP